MKKKKGVRECGGGGSSDDDDDVCQANNEYNNNKNLVKIESKLTIMLLSSLKVTIKLTCYKWFCGAFLGKKGLN